MNNPMAQVYKTFVFEIKIDIPTISGQGTPSFRNKIAEMCYLYRRTGLQEMIERREILARRVEAKSERLSEISGVKRRGRAVWEKETRGRAEKKVGIA